MKQFLTSVALAVLCLGTQFFETAIAATGQLSTPWVEGHNSRVRLIAGGSTESVSGLVAGVEVQMPIGWKTYWRSPGEAGGVPPAFDWSKSKNLAKAQVLYPAPQRFTDRSGDTVGYKEMVVFPVQLVPADPTKPIELRLQFDYGICKDICIPAEAALSLTIAANSSTALPVQLSAALDSVPRKGDDAQSSRPSLTRVVSELGSKRPHVLLETEFPTGATHFDAFVEGPPGLYVPLPKKTTDKGDGRVTFDLDLSEGVDIEEIKDATLLLTLVSDTGQSETAFNIR